MQIIKSENNKSLLIDLLVIVCIWFGSIAIVNPLGDFPLNDDWAFAQTVKRLLETGDYLPTAWMGMSLVSNAIWGALFCLPGGFSFTALRISTLTISLAGMIGVYWIAKDLQLPRPLRICAALTLAFNPIYFALSHTFMTDVAFTALQTLSALFLLRCLHNDSGRSLCIGIGIAVAATLSRQLGIAVPLAFAIAYLFRFGLGYRQVLRGISPATMCIAALLLFQHWLSAKGALPAVYVQQNASFLATLRYPGVLLTSESINIYASLLYLGLFILPSLLPALPAIALQQTGRNINTWLAILIVGGMTFIFSRYVGEPRLPLFGNTFGPAGIGPFTLKDTYILGSSHLPVLANEFWVAMTWLGLFGAVLIVAALIFFAKQMLSSLRQGKTTFDKASSFFLLLCAAAYLFPIFTGAMADRYLLPVIPLLILGILSLFAKTDFAHGRLFRYLGFSFLLAFSLFSISAAKDYLAWNRLRWQALRELMQIDNVSSKDIDGGFEFNGWNFYDPNYVQDPNKSWWWVQGDTYLISFQGVLGYSTVKEYSYSHWLPPYTGQILVLKKNADFHGIPTNTLR